MRGQSRKLAACTREPDENASRRIRAARGNSKRGRRRKSRQSTVCATLCMCARIDTSPRCGPRPRGWLIIYRVDAILVIKRRTPCHESTRQVFNTPVRPRNAFSTDDRRIYSIICQSEQFLGADSPFEAPQTFVTRSVLSNIRDQTEFLGRIFRSKYSGLYFIEIIFPTNFETLCTRLVY